MKHNNICTIGLQEVEMREQGIKNLFEEIMTENLPNLVKEKDTLVQKVQSPKKDGPEEVHTKKHRNFNCKA